MVKVLINHKELNKLSKELLELCKLIKIDNKKIVLIFLIIEDEIQL